MKKVLAVVAVVGGLALVTAAFAHGPGGYGRGWGMGPGMMGQHGPRGTQFGPGAYGCPGFGAQTEAQAITADQAKEIAQNYADQYLKGFTVERVLPFTGMHHTMYSVELKGPNDEVRTFHINPWGNVMPFGGPLARPR